ncbi:hypothetical protein Tco_0504540, partial [Tanacetum coccineum]
MVDCRLWIKFMVWGTPGILKMWKAGQSLEELSAVEAPSIRETSYA